MTTENTATPPFPLSRDAGNIGPAIRRIWASRWAKIAAILVAIPILAYIALWFLFARGLPSADKLLTYEPALPSHVRGINGEVVQTFARERRVVLEYEEYPRQMIEALIAAQDRSLFQHRQGERRGGTR